MSDVMLLPTVGVFLLLASVPLAVQIGGPLLLRRVPPLPLIEDVYADIEARRRRRGSSPTPTPTERPAPLEQVEVDFTQALKRLFERARSHSRSILRAVNAGD